MLKKAREMWGRASAAIGRAERWLEKSEDSLYFHRQKEEREQALLSYVQKSGAGTVMRYNRHTRQSRLCEEIRVAELMRRLEGATPEQLHQIVFLLDTRTNLWNEAAFKPKSGVRYRYYLASTEDGMREFHLWLIEQGALWNASRSNTATLDRFDQVVNEVLGVPGQDTSERVAA